MCYSFIIITECVIQVRQHYPDAFSQIDESHKIIGFRTYLTHRFKRFNLQILLENSQQPLSILIAQSQAILNQLGSQPTPGPHTQP